MPSKILLLIQADTNDADYVQQDTEISEKRLEELKPVFEAISKVSHKRGKWVHVHNWPRHDYRENESPEQVYKGKLTQEQIDNFDDLCPRGEYGIHTITEIRVLKVVSDNVYLERYK